MAVLCYSYSVGHVLHHFTLQRSCLLQSGALPGRYGFLFLFLPPSAPLESSSAGSRSRLESDFASQSRSSASARGREHWWWVTALQQRTPRPGTSAQQQGQFYLNSTQWQDISLIEIKFTSSITKDLYFQWNFFFILFSFFNDHYFLSSKFWYVNKGWTNFISTN